MLFQNLAKNSVKNPGALVKDPVVMVSSIEFSRTWPKVVEMTAQFWPGSGKPK